LPAACSVTPNKVNPPPTPAKVVPAAMAGAPTGAPATVAVAIAPPVMKEPPIRVRPPPTVVAARPNRISESVNQQS